MKKIVIILLILAQSCSIFEAESGELLYTQEKPQEGFKFPYYLFIPDGCLKEREIILVVESNNSGLSDDFGEHIEATKRTATKDFYIGNYVSRKLKIPLLVPVFPRSKSTWKMYTHALDKDVVMQKNTNLERIDLQLLAMVEDANKKLKQLGYTVNEKILMTGYSASGTFANRFTLIHPEKVLAMAAGGLNGLLILPLNEFKGKKLNYPLGTNDFHAIFEKPFDTASFINTPQFLFMGDLDDNDAIPYKDGYEDNDRELIYELLGKQMQPLRWNKCIEIYKHEKVNAQLKTYKDVGHEHPERIQEDILTFFKNNIKK